jgi:hypothetical protein
VQQANRRVRVIDGTPVYRFADRAEARRRA